MRMGVVWDESINGLWDLDYLRVVSKNDVLTEEERWNQGN